MDMEDEGKATAMKNVQTTQILPEDEETIFSLAKAHVDRYEDITQIDYPAVMAWYKRKIAVKRSEYRRIMYDGQLAGYIRVADNGSETELDDLYLFPEYQGRGIGTAIITQCCAAAAGPVFFYVFTANRRAMALYKRLGFSIVQQVGNTRCIMRKG